jgi:hypothetical protein
VTTEIYGVRCELYRKYEGVVNCYH